ncbi:hypothetical protein V1507DRAFT_339834 [Lipomyces tetrasporus]
MEKSQLLTFLVLVWPAEHNNYCPQGLLPRLRDSVLLVLPPQPSEPPTDLDLATARTYFACVRTLREDAGLDDDRRPSQLEEADSLRYLNDVRERIRITRMLASMDFNNKSCLRPLTIRH